MKPAQPITFRIYPTKRSRLWWEVRVYPSMTAMRRAFSKHKGTVDRTSAGACSSWIVESVAADGTYRRKQGMNGIIWLARTRLWSEVITHEVAHAAIAYLRRLKRLDIDEDSTDWASKNEELLCDAVGKMTYQCYLKLGRLKLIT